VKEKSETYRKKKASDSKNNMLKRSRTIK